VKPETFFVCWLLAATSPAAYGDWLFSKPETWPSSLSSDLSWSKDGWEAEISYSHYSDEPIGFRIQSFRLATLPLNSKAMNYGLVSWPGLAMGTVCYLAYYQLTHFGPHGNGIGYPLILMDVSLLGAVYTDAFHPQLYVSFGHDLKFSTGYDIDLFSLSRWCVAAKVYSELTWNEAGGTYVTYPGPQLFYSARFSAREIYFSDRGWTQLRQGLALGIGLGYHF
jgi:hypothetical protein